MVEKYKETILYSVLLIFVIVFTFSQVQPKIAEFLDAQKDFSKISAEYKDLKRTIDDLKASATTKDSSFTDGIKKVYKPNVRNLDAESSFTVLFDDIIEIAKINSIKIYSMEYIYNPATDEFVVGSPDKYNVCQLNLKVIGDYTDLESFFQSFYKYPYLINMDKIELLPYEKDKSIILGDLQLKLYALK